MTQQSKIYFFRAGKRYVYIWKTTRIPCHSFDWWVNFLAINLPRFQAAQSATCLLPFYQFLFTWSPQDSPPEEALLILFLACMHVSRLKTYRSPTWPLDWQPFIPEDWEDSWRTTKANISRLFPVYLVYMAKLEEGTGTCGWLQGWPLWV